MASDGQEIILNARQYLKWLGVSHNRYSDSILCEWFWMLRNLVVKKSDLEILYDLYSESIDL